MFLMGGGACKTWEWARAANVIVALLREDDFHWRLMGLLFFAPSGCWAVGQDVLSVRDESDAILNSY